MDTTNSCFYRPELSWRAQCRSLNIGLLTLAISIAAVAGFVLSNTSYGNFFNNTFKWAGSIAIIVLFGSISIVAFTILLVSKRREPAVVQGALPIPGLGAQQVELPPFLALDDLRLWLQTRHLRPDPPQPVALEGWEEAKQALALPDGGRERVIALNAFAKQWAARATTSSQLEAVMEFRFMQLRGLNFNEEWPQFVEASRDLGERTPTFAERAPRAQLQQQKDAFVRDLGEFVDHWKAQAQTGLQLREVEMCHREQINRYNGALEVLHTGHPELLPPGQIPLPLEMQLDFRGFRIATTTLVLPDLTLPPEATGEQVAQLPAHAAEFHQQLQLFTQTWMKRATVTHELRSVIKFYQDKVAAANALSADHNRRIQEHNRRGEGIPFPLIPIVDPVYGEGMVPFDYMEYAFVRTQWREMEDFCSPHLPPAHRIAALNLVRFYILPSPIREAWRQLYRDAPCFAVAALSLPDRQQVQELAQFLDLPPRTIVVQGEDGRFWLELEATIAQINSQRDFEQLVVFIQAEAALATLDCPNFRELQLLCRLWPHWETLARPNATAREKTAAMETLARELPPPDAYSSSALRLLCLRQYADLVASPAFVRFEFGQGGAQGQQQTEVAALRRANENLSRQLGREAPLDIPDIEMDVAGDELQAQQQMQQQFQRITQTLDALFLNGSFDELGQQFRDLPEASKLPLLRYLALSNENLYLHLLPLYLTSIFREDDTAPVIAVFVEIEQRHHDTIFRAIVDHPLLSRTLLSIIAQ
ncbi:MAG: hypothetical protein ACKVOH_00295 [Chlamydiales bacterium]